MLYPQENKIRGIIDLNGVWDFALGTTAVSYTHLRAHET